MVYGFESKLCPLLAVWSRASYFPFQCISLHTYNVKSPTVTVPQSPAPLLTQTTSLEASTRAGTGEGDLRLGVSNPNGPCLARQSLISGLINQSSHVIRETQVGISSLSESNRFGGRPPNLNLLETATPRYAVPFLIHKSLEELYQGQQKCDGSTPHLAWQPRVTRSPAHLCTRVENEQKAQHYQ